MQNDLNGEQLAKELLRTATDRTNNCDCLTASLTPTREPGASHKARRNNERTS